VLREGSNVSQGNWHNTGENDDIIVCVFQNKGVGVCWIVVEVVVV